MRTLVLPKRHPILHLPIGKATPRNRYPTSRNIQLGSDGGGGSPALFLALHTVADPLATSASPTKTRTLVLSKWHQILLVLMTETTTPPTSRMRGQTQLQQGCSMPFETICARITCHYNSSSSHIAEISTVQLQTKCQLLLLYLPTLPSQWLARILHHLLMATSPIQPQSPWLVPTRGPLTEPLLIHP